MPKSRYFFAALAIFLLSANAHAVSNVIACTIFDMNGKVVRYFKGDVCVFFPDGSLVAGSATALTFYRKDMTVRWSKKTDAHHQLNPGADGKTLLVMTSSIHPYRGTKVRFDRLLVTDLDGNELRSFDFYDHRDEIAGISRFAGSLWKLKDDEVRGGARFEFSHVNSFYELEPNEAEKKNAAFRSGGYLVNSVLLNTFFVFDHELKKILWSKVLAESEAPTKHDLQMLPSGKMIFYNNWLPAGQGGVSEVHSAIEEYDPLSDRVRTIYSAKPPEKFFMRYCGGVQTLPNGDILTNDDTSGGAAFEITPGGKRVWSMLNPVKNTKTGKADYFQQIRRIDLTDFLKNNEGY